MGNKGFRYSRQNILATRKENNEDGILYIAFHFKIGLMKICSNHRSPFRFKNTCTAAGLKTTNDYISITTTNQAFYE